MYNDQGKIKTLNTVGIFTGVALALIPFYSLYILIKSFSLLSAPLKLMTVLTKAAQYSIIGVSIASIVDIIGRDVQSNKEFESFVAEVTNKIEVIGYIGYAAIVLAVITLVLFHKQLGESDDKFNDEERFLFTKSLGAQSTAIPFYTVYAAVRAFAERTNYSSESLTYVAVYAVLSFLYTLNTYIPVAIFSGLPFMLAVLIVSIITAVKYKEVYYEITLVTKNKEDDEQYFVSE